MILSRFRVGTWQQICCRSRVDEAEEYLADCLPLMGKNCEVSMEEECLDPILFYASVFERVEVEEEEEEVDDFRSCCEGDDLEEKNELLIICPKANVDDVDDFSVRMYFKGVSVAPIVDSDSGLSGIGVVMEGPTNSSPILVQKKIDFFVNESVSNYLALMDGLIEAKQKKILKVFAFTDSALLCDQINHNKFLEDSLHIALKQRIVEHTNSFESFTLQLVSGNDLKGASKLARVAVGIVSFPINDNESIETCSICCEQKLASMMITLKCNDRFCSQCMKTYVEGKLKSGQVSVRCPEHKCTYCLANSECKTFLPLNTYDKLEKALCVSKIIPSDTIYCPHPNCSVLLDPRVSSSSRLECPVCHRLICVKCKVPWHLSLTCQQYQVLSFEEMDASRQFGVKRQRKCHQCYRILELSSGCCRMTCCWCGYEFCFSRGAEYEDGEPSCECTFCMEDESEYVESDPSQACKQWGWDSYDSVPIMMDMCSEQQKSEQELINRFLFGNFSLNDDKDYESSSPSVTNTCADVMKDLQELPWLERFVSLIDDTYNEEYL